MPSELDPHVQTALDGAKELHRLVGLGIEELYEDRLPELFESLALHFDRGEVWDKAVVSFQQAGAKAMGRSAYREAVAHFL